MASTAGERTRERPKPGQELSTRAFEIYFADLAARDIPADRLAEGVGVPLDALRDSDGWVSWDAGRAFSHNVEQLWSDAELIELNMRPFQAVSRSSHWPVRLLFSMVEGYRFVSLEIERTFKVLDVCVTERASDRLQIEVRLDRGFQLFRAAAVGLIGLFRAVPITYGLPPAEVEVQTADGCLFYDVRVHPNRGALSWLRRLVFAPLAARAVLPRLARAHEQLQLRYQELSRTNRELQESEDRFNALFDNAQDLIGEADVTGRILVANPSWCRTLGYGPEELARMTVFDLLHPEDRALAAMQLAEVMRGERPDPVRSRVRHRDGSWRWVEGAGTVYETASGEKRILTISRDITEQRHEEERRAEYARRLEHEVSQHSAQLRELQARHLHAEHVKAAEDLAGSVAHVINNPLAALLATVEMARERAAAPDPTLDRVVHLARRIRDVVDRTLDLFRRGGLNLEDADPRDILRTVADEVRRLASAGGVELRVECPRDLPPARVDRALVVAALVGLAENAVEASSEGGELLLEAESVEVADCIRFRVSDRGPGIPEEIRAKVVEPFFTTRAGGTGLGLAIVRGVVRGHGGHLEIGDRPGGGAAISVDLPRSES